MSDDESRMKGGAFRGTLASSRGTTWVPPRTRVAQAASPPVPRTFAEKLQAQKDAQAEAERLVRLLRPLYAKMAKYAPRGASQHPPGDSVNVTVLDAPRYNQAYDEQRFANVEEARGLLTTYAPYETARKLSEPESPVPAPSKITPKTKLPAAALKYVIPDPEPSTTVTAGGFWSAKRDRLFVRIDQVDIAIVAHELGHAYASRRWNEFVLALWLQMQPPGLPAYSTMRDLATAIDEGVCSVIAQSVLDVWYASLAPADRPPFVPRGEVGYVGSVMIQGQRFISGVDGGLGKVPGANTFSAYFGGAIVFTIDGTVPTDSDVRCGRAKSVKLWSLV